MMTTEQQRALAADPDGLATYEFIANNIEVLTQEDIELLASNMIQVDVSGQFCTSADTLTPSTARHMHRRCAG